MSRLSRSMAKNDPKATSKSPIKRLRLLCVGDLSPRKHQGLVLTQKARMMGGKRKSPILLKNCRRRNWFASVPLSASVPVISMPIPVKIIVEIRTTNRKAIPVLKGLHNSLFACDIALYFCSNGKDRRYRARGVSSIARTHGGCE